jgi:undecaprenyl diphosphate synthase
MNDKVRRPISTSIVPAGGAVPLHVAVIMDGNGRWARKRALPRIAGHRRGMETVRMLVRACGEAGVSYLTLFAFSSENWRRPAREVQLLMELFSHALETEVRKLNENNVRLRVVGDLDRFSVRIRESIKRAENLTRDNTALNLTIAANYGGRWDITQACRRLAEEVAAGQLSAEQIDAERLDAHLSTHFLPEPDLFIRTGGEQRISNFLLWQLAYTELYFTPVLWPDFDREEFQRALESFSARERRFGQTGEQVGKANNA